MKNVCAALWLLLLPTEAFAQSDVLPGNHEGASDTERKRHFEESIVVTGAALEPKEDRRSGRVFASPLLGRDDQIFQALGAGISAGQHEGGGKSVEIRRFGFNLDHGGVSGGLKVLVDGVGQNQQTQGHGQGYLGSLKDVTPELIEDVEIVGGPFNARYGDFSGLGVVHIRLKDRLDDRATLRLQAGSFASRRAFAAVGKSTDATDSFVAYEGARADGPFLNPLGHARDNLTASLSKRWNGQSAGLRFRAGRNDFRSSGQLPLAEVASGRLDRFGFVDPNLGGRIRTATLAGTYRKASGEGVLSVDAFLARSLFDLYSNFTFFLNDEDLGDQIQQHDSRLQEGANAEYSMANTLFGRRGAGTLGASVHASQIRVGLSPSANRAPRGFASLAHATIADASAYASQSLDLTSRLRVEAGLRIDAFRFDVDDLATPSASGGAWDLPLQPKAGLVWRPFSSPATGLHGNYGHGIASQDARGIVRHPSAPKVSTTDFYELGLSHTGGRSGIALDFFWIDRSNEQVYVPDDGSVELRGPSRAYGFEVKGSLHLGSAVALTAYVTRVLDAHYKNTSPRLVVEGAPRVVADVGLELLPWRGFAGSVRLRHTSSYRLDGADPRILASGLDVIDLGVTRRMGPRLALSVSVDNLANARYYETQNYFTSRIRPGEPAMERIHGTPGYPRTVVLGLTLTPILRR